MGIGSGNANGIPGTREFAAMGVSITGGPVIGLWFAARSRSGVPALVALFATSRAAERWAKNIVRIVRTEQQNNSKES